MTYLHTIISFIAGCVVCILCIYFNNSTTLTLATDKIGIPRNIVDNYKSCVNKAIDVIHDVSDNLFKKQPVFSSSDNEHCSDSVQTQWGTVISGREDEPIPMWGSFRPGLYFGMKRRSASQRVRESTLSTGVMWAKDSLHSRSFRHLTSQDELKKFEWIRHDGRSFGSQQLQDDQHHLQLSTSFVVPHFLTETNTDTPSRPRPVWIQRVTLDSTTTTTPSTSPPDSPNLLVFYFGNSDVDSSLPSDPGLLSNLQVSVSTNVSSHSSSLTATCSSSSLGRLTLILHFRTSSVDSSSSSVPSVSFLGTDDDVTSGTDSLLQASQHLFVGQQQGLLTVNGDLSDTVSTSSRFLAVQVKVSSSVSLQMDALLFEGEGEGVDSLLEEVSQLFSFSSQTFDRKFDRLFPSMSSFSSPEQEAARRALSAVLGGIGHFQGVPRIGRGEKDDGVFESWRKDKDKHFVSLLTGTPSRTSFPRGFLWDEGFHQLLVVEWDIGLTSQILSDWLSAMQFSEDMSQGGWIPREMILGEEARRRVPDEFVTQRTDVANPPTLLLVVEKLMQRVNNNNNVNLLPALRELFPRLHVWLQWFLSSQAGTGDSPHSFRWRGRSLSDRKLVANTLSSGLDDYPRAQIPSEEERHVDLHSWMARSCDIMGKLQSLLLQKSEKVEVDFEYSSLAVALQSRLEDLHWNEATESYCDFGLHNDSSYFVTELFFRCSNPTDKSYLDIAVPAEVYKSGTPFCPATHPQMLFPHGDGNGNYKTRELFVQASNFSLEFVPRFGYVSIFPLLLKVVDPLSSRLTDLFNVLESPNGLWTEFGLRSIAKVDKFYRRSNAPGDAPYWRGPIWININYLALAALHHYKADPKLQPNYSDLSKQEMKTVEKQTVRAEAIYHKLRNNLIKNVLGEYLKTGFFWEQYDDQTGSGIRGHPFTGWTTLIVNIMAEKY